MPHSPPGERGQASVELVALLPLMAALATVGWQVAVAGKKKAGKK